MSYETDNDPYIDKDAGVLRNLLGLTTEAALAAAEASITYESQVIFLAEGYSSDKESSRAYLCSVHRQLFEDIYDWAGELRTVRIEKDTTTFAMPEHIVSQLDKLLDELKNEDCLQNLERDAFIERLTHYYAELNVIHPFREGNGRAIRAFLTVIMYDTRWYLAWDNMGRVRNILACEAAYFGDEKPLMEMLESIVISRV